MKEAACDETASRWKAAQLPWHLSVCQPDASCSWSFQFRKKKKADKSIFRKRRRYRNHLTSPSRLQPAEEPRWCSACGLSRARFFLIPALFPRSAGRCEAAEIIAKRGESGHGSKKKKASSSSLSCPGGLTLCLLACGRRGQGRGRNKRPAGLSRGGLRPAD